MLCKSHIPRMNDDFWDRVCEFSYEIWNVCESVELSVVLKNLLRIYMILIS